MTQPAKVQEPSMEEILASIRRIIADDETKTPASEQPPAAKSAPVAAAAAAKPAPVAGAAGSSAMANEPPKPAAKAASNSQDDIDALMADFDAPAAPIVAPKPAAPEDDVLELTDDMALPDMPEPTFDKVEPANDLEFNEVAMASERRYPAAERSPGAGRGGVEAFAPEMLSQSTVSAVESAFNSLANTVLSNNARTLEDLVREMLRPMLKSWLDDNLPGLVERIVKAEIERVSRGR